MKMRDNGFEDDDQLTRVLLVFNIPRSLMELRTRGGGPQLQDAWALGGGDGGGSKSPAGPLGAPPSSTVKWLLG